MNKVFDKVARPDFKPISIKLHPESDWHCHLFGGTSKIGVDWRPYKGEEPNWFWRKMQYLAFGFKWIKD